MTSLVNGHTLDFHAQKKDGVFATLEYYTRSLLNYNHRTVVYYWWIAYSQSTSQLNYNHTYHEYRSVYCRPVYRAKVVW